MEPGDSLISLNLVSDHSVQGSLKSHYLYSNETLETLKLPSTESRETGLTETQL